MPCCPPLFLMLVSNYNHRDQLIVHEIFLMTRSSCSRLAAVSHWYATTEGRKWSLGKETQQYLEVWIQLKIEFSYTINYWFAGKYNNFCIVSLLVFFSLVLPSAIAPSASQLLFCLSPFNQTSCRIISWEQLWTWCSNFGALFLICLLLTAAVVFLGIEVKLVAYVPIEWAIAWVLISQASSARLSISSQAAW